MKIMKLLEKLYKDIKLRNKQVFFFNQQGKENFQQYLKLKTKMEFLLH